MTIQTKLNVGDECYYLRDNKVEQSVVEGIQTKVYSHCNGIEHVTIPDIKYQVENINKNIESVIKLDITSHIISESEIFPTKELLLASL